MDLITFKQMPYYDIIEFEYENLCGRGDSRATSFLVPFIGDLNKEVLESVELAKADQLVKEAVGRGDYEIYGMDRRLFLAEAYRGSIEGFRNTIPFESITEAVFAYLVYCNVAHFDYWRDFINSPVRCVW